MPLDPNNPFADLVPSGTPGVIYGPPDDPKPPPNVPSGYEPDPTNPGAIRPMKGGPNDPTAGGTASASDLTGPDYLKTLDKPTAALVQALAEGRKAFPSGAALRNPYWQNMLTHVSNFDPGFDETTYTSRAATRKDFNIGTAGKNVRALNTAIGHLGQLYGQIGDTASHSFTPLNVVENAARAHILGQSGPTTYASTTSALAGELTAVYRGAGGAEADIKRYIDELSPNASEEQKRATIGNIAGLLNSRLEALQDQYKKGMGVGATMQFLDPHAEQVLNSLKSGGQLPAPGSNSPPAAPSGGAKELTPEQQKEFFGILKVQGPDAGNAYLQKFGLALKDPELAKHPYSEAIQYLGETPLVQSFNDIAGGIVKGAAALPDMAARAVGNIMAVPVEALGYGDAANSLRNPVQFGNLVDEKIPVSTQPMGALNRFAGEFVGAGLGVPAKATNALAEMVAGRVPVAPALGATPAGKTIAEAANRQNVRLLPADVGGEVVKSLTSAAAQSPLSRGAIVRLARQGTEDLQNAAGRAANQAGRAMTPDEAGEAVRRGGTEWIRQTTDRASRWYDRANEIADNIKIMPASAAAILDQHIAEIKQAGPIAEGMLKELEKVRGTLHQEGGITITGMRRARSLLGAMARNDTLRGTDAGRIFGEVLDAAHADMVSGLTAAGKGNAARMFDRADTLWRERIQHIDQVLEPIIGKAKSGEDIMRAVDGMASNQGSRGGVRRLQRIIETLPKEEKGDVVATIIERLGKAKPSAQDETGSAFSPETFLTNWNSISGKAKRVLFGNGDLRQNLDDIAMLTAAKRETNKLASKSNTPIGLTANVGAYAAGGAALGPQAAAIGAALQYGTGRLLASPQFTRWLARMPKTAVGINRHIGRLPYIARSSPVIANDIDAVFQGLNQPMVPALAASPNVEGQNNESQ